MAKRKKKKTGKKRILKKRTGRRKEPVRKPKKGISKKRKFGKRAKQRGRFFKTASLKKPGKKGERERGEELVGKGNLDEFVKLGKQRGFVTEDEILQAIPEVEKNVDKLETL